MLSILKILFEQPKAGFLEIQHEIDLSPTTLSKRLQELEDFGIVSREAIHTIPPRVFYSLTTRGRNLSGVFQAIDSWEELYTR